MRHRGLALLIRAAFLVVLARAPRAILLAYLIALAGNTTAVVFVATLTAALSACIG
jgi:hypothetical protein